MKKRKLRFFLDYGACLWAVDDDELYGALSPEDLPLSITAQAEINCFLVEYHQSYDYGCPPSEDWTVDDCKKFNAEHKRILNLVISELNQQFIICNEQFDLIEDLVLLSEFYSRGREFINERISKF